MNIVENRYGKSRVRMARIVRSEGRHDFHEMTVAIAVEGDFDSSYREGDNSLVLPTDTMKNTVYALAKQPEGFARLLASHFLGHFKHLSHVNIEIQAYPWSRNGPYSFTGGPGHRRIAKLVATRDKLFLRDEYTTLPETSLDVMWSGDANWDDVMKSITGTFAAHDSKSVRHTLYAIGEAVPGSFPAIVRIRLTDVFLPTDEPHGLIEAVLSR
jgi:urate oxidase